jgi:hypothetical protein
MIAKEMPLRTWIMILVTTFVGEKVVVIIAGACASLELSMFLSVAAM